MTSNDDTSERQVKLQGHRTRALSYGECLYDAIRGEKDFLLLINNGGTSFIL
jgi:hypothetical protein